MSTLTFGFIGLGLIGGSIARAIRQNLPQSQIIAYDINADTLREAAQCGVANVITTRIDASFSDCDYLFLCAPVQKNDENLSAVKEILSPKTLLTDVGSVKSEIHTEIKKAGLEGQFIGGHPMAGSDRIGFINSKAVLLENAYYILTPTDSVPENKVTDYKNLVQQLGAIPLILEPAQHDYVTAAVSHLPPYHCRISGKSGAGQGFCGRTDEDDRCRRFQGHYQNCLFFRCGMAADLPDQYRKYLDTVVLLHCFPPGNPTGTKRQTR